MRTSVVIAGIAALALFGHAAARAQDSAAGEPPPPPAPSAAPADAAGPAPTPSAPEPPPTAAADDQPPAPPPPPANSGDYGGRGPTDDNAGAAGPRAREPAPPPRNPDDYEAEPEDSSSHGDTGPHEFSIRFDPFNWLLAGRLGIELEYGVWKFISIEMIPVLVANTKPPAIDFGGFDSALSQHSNGIGPFSGTSLGAAFWLQGEPFSGYVLRFLFTNYGYTYRAQDAAGTFDRVNFTERRFVGFFGSHSRFGPFTLAGGFGLGYELNQQERCGLTLATPSGGGEAGIDGRHSNCNGKQLIATDRTLSNGVADLNGSLHPIYLEARFSLGFVF